MSQPDSATSQADQVDNPVATKSMRSIFFEHLYSASSNPDKIIPDLNNLKFCYGYDITIIVFLFQKNKLSAKVQLENENKEINTVVFFEGQIQYIELADADTRIGTLLVNSGLVSKNQLEFALKNKADQPLGVFLVQQGIINREQVGSLLLSQSRSRLSKLINDHKYLIKISDSETKIKSSELNVSQFYLLLHDWILSKFQADWLNAHYLEYYNTKIQVNWSNFDMGEASKYSVLNMFTESFIDIIDQQPVSDLSIRFENNKNFFKALHFLVLLNWISLIPLDSEPNHEILIKHIYKLIMNKNGLELLRKLSLITKRDENHIDQIQDDLHKNFLGPENITNEFKLEIDKKVMSLLLNSRTLNPAQAKSQVDKKQIAPKVIDVKAIKNLLLQQKYNEALAIVKKNKDLLSTTAQLQLFSAWAHAGLALFKGTQISAATLESEFINILPEDMNTADYHYVNYLVLKFKKQEAQCNQSLKKAIELDPNIKNYPVIKSIFGWF